MTTDTAHDDQQTDDAGEQQPDAGTNAEAARYRVRAREAEAANEYLRVRLDTLTRRDVDRLTKDRLAQSADLFDFGGVTLDDLVDEEGDVDEDKVEQAVNALLADRPGLARVEPRTPDFGAGARGSSATGSGDGWAAVLGKDRRRR